MTANVTTRQRWDTTEYGNVVAAHFRDGVLHVTFEDGSEVGIPVERLDGGDLRSPDWSAAKPGPFWVTIPTADGTTEISWVTLRLLSDPAFEAYWLRRADERARRIGDRVRAMREERRWSPAQLAERVGISAQTVESIEAGRERVGLLLLERIVAVFGRTLDDLSEVPDAP